MRTILTLLCWALVAGRILAIATPLPRPGTITEEPIDTTTEEFIGTTMEESIYTTMEESIDKTTEAAHAGAPTFA